MSVFAITANDRGDTYVVHAGGELDLAGCSTLTHALHEAEQSQADRIVLDLGDLTFIDLRGLQTIVEASRRSASNGDRLQLTRATGGVAYMFRLTELDSVLPFADGYA